MSYQYPTCPACKRHGHITYHTTIDDWQRKITPAPTPARSTARKGKTA